MHVNFRLNFVRTHNTVSRTKIAQSSLLSYLYLSMWNSVCWPL